MTRSRDHLTLPDRTGRSVLAVVMTMVVIGLAVWTDEHTDPADAGTPSTSGRPTGESAATRRSTDLGHATAESIGEPPDTLAETRRPTDASNAIPPGRLAGRIVDDAGTPIGGSDASVVAWPLGFDEGAVRAAIQAGREPVREIRVDADGTFSLEGLPPGSQWRVAIRGFGMWSDDERPWTAFDRFGDARPVHDLVVREITAGRFRIEDPRGGTEAPPPFGLEVHPVSFSTRGVRVLDADGLIGVLAGIDRWEQDRAPTWNEGFFFSSTQLGDPGQGFLGLSVSMPGYRGAIQLVRVAGVRTQEVPTTGLTLGRPPVEIGDLPWATDLDLRWPESPPSQPSYWWIGVDSDVDSPASSRVLAGEHARPLSDADLPGGTLHGIVHGSRRVRIVNRLGYEAVSEPTEVGAEFVGFAVARATDHHGEIRFSTAQGADELQVVILGPEGIETRIALSGPVFVLPFAPVGSYRALPAAALEPTPPPVRRRDPRLRTALEDSPALGAWSDAVEFVVRAGEQTLVGLQ